MIFLITLAGWITITGVIVGLCHAARLGDRLEQEQLFQIRVREPVGAQCAGSPYRQAS
jgi:hypothetical protein